LPHIGGGSGGGGGGGGGGVWCGYLYCESIQCLRIRPQLQKDNDNISAGIVWRRWYSGYCARGVSTKQCWGSIALLRAGRCKATRCKNNTAEMMVLPILFETQNPPLLLAIDGKDVVTVGC